MLSCMYSAIIKLYIKWEVFIFMKKSILVMTYGSPESYDFDGICEFFTNIRKGKRPNDDK